MTDRDQTLVRPERWQVHPGAHSVPRAVRAREILAWLDRYLGPVE